MGLDQYAYIKSKRRHTLENTITDLDRETEFYWRKYYCLQDAVEKLFKSRVGHSISFNCIEIHLTLEDLDYLENEMSSNPEFQEHWSEASSEDLKKFIEQGRNALKRGKEVTYDSWW